MPVNNGKQNSILTSTKLAKAVLRGSVFGGVIDRVLDTQASLADGTSRERSGMEGVVSEIPFHHSLTSTVESYLHTRNIVYDVRLLERAVRLIAEENNVALASDAPEPGTYKILDSQIPDGFRLRGFDKLYANLTSNVQSAREKLDPEDEKTIDTVDALLTEWYIRPSRSVEGIKDPETVSEPAVTTEPIGSTTPAVEPIKSLSASASTPVVSRRASRVPERIISYLKGLNVDSLSAEQRVIKIFQILNSRRNPNKRFIQEEEFRQFRRSVGNTNYSKAYYLLFVFWVNSMSQQDKNEVEKAAAILGTLRKARKNYFWFLHRIKDKTN